MTTEVDADGLVRGRIESVADGELVLSIPHTEYRLHLVPTVPAGEIDVPVGKEVRGVIQANALRIHAARGGGRFIEPVWGEPRIVAGTVRRIDEPQRRVLVDVGVPMWVTAPEKQDLSRIREGELVNFYVESGATFRPVIR